jgi:hypothetical protein
LRVDRAGIDWAARVLLAADAGAPPTADAVLFFLRTWVERGRDDLKDRLELGLTHALDVCSPRHVDPSEACARMAWLHVASEASFVTDDPRLTEAVRDGLPHVIDALETFIRRSYEPGEGLIDATCDEQLRCGIALLMAFDLSGRLPYAMLAEELLQDGRRRWLQPSGEFRSGFAGNCVATQLLCRVARLHQDDDYVRRAVVAPDRPYAQDARRALSTLVPQAGTHPFDAAAFGNALLDWFALEPNLQ